MINSTPPHWLVYGCRTTFVPEVTEILWRLGADVAAFVDNLPDGPSILPDGRIVLPDDLTDNERLLPCVIPLITPGHRHTVVADARSYGIISFPKLIDPTAVVARSAVLGEGAVINALAIVGAQSRLGRFVHMNRGASIGHHASVGDFVTFGPGSVLAAQVHVESGAFIAAGAIITPKVRIGANAFIKAGAVVSIDIPANGIVAGNPARIERVSETGYGRVAVPPSEFV